MLMYSPPELRVRPRDAANLTSPITHPVGTDEASMTDSNSSARDAALIS